MAETDSEESRELLSSDLAILNNMKQEMAETVSDRIASHTQIGFCYVALLKILGQVNEVEQLKWKDEFAAIHTWQDAARFMTKAKLKIYYDSPL